MAALLALSRAIDAVTTVIGKSVSWLLLAAVLISTGNAILRKAMDISSNAWLEIQWYLFGSLVLLGARARWGRGPTPAPLLSNLASGAALMLALRAALTGAAWPSLAAWLTVALVAHLAELAIRFRRSDPAPRGTVTMRPGTTESGGRSVRVRQ